MFSFTVLTLMSATIRLSGDFRQLQSNMHVCLWSVLLMCKDIEIEQEAGAARVRQICDVICVLDVPRVSWGVGPSLTDSFHSQPPPQYSGSQESFKTTIMNPLCLQSTL